MVSGRVLAVALTATGLASSSILEVPNAATIDLTSLSWTISWRNGSLPARIPSQAHLDLLVAGFIEEPTYGDNDAQQAWIASEPFTYRSSEILTLNKSSELSTYLIFDGIDTFANVSFCGQMLSEVNNQFRRWEFDVTPSLANCSSPRVEVVFHPAPPISTKLIDDAYKNAGNSCIPCYATRFQFPGRQFIRKEQSDYGWDWGPGFAPQGIWQPARIVQVAKQEDNVKIKDVYIDVYKENQINNLPPDMTAPWVLNVSVDYFGALAQHSLLSAEVYTSSGELFETIQLTDLNYQLGSLSGSAILSNRPDLWWPLGYGEQTLYNINVSVLSAYSSVIDTASKRIGFRTIVLNQTPISLAQLENGVGPGDNWHFEINGHEIYVKGSNLVPLDPFWPRVTKADMEVLFKSAMAANHNMLRVWSSNIYLPDFAYDLADELGLLLWSEFQFSDAFHPNDTASIQNYVEEARYQVRRLNSHPSLALWCGGNELELALLLVAIGAKENYAAAVENYESIFLDALIHAVYDNTRSISYISSSINYGYESFDYNRSQPIKPRYSLPTDGGYYGVIDYYNYDPTKAFDLDTYPKTARFVDEFGFISHSSYKTYSKFMPQDQLSFNSSLMLHRNRHYPLNIADLAVQDPYQNATDTTNKSLEGLGQMSTGATLYYPSPNKTNPATNFSMQIYATQLFQAEFTRSQIDFYRRASGQPQRNLGSLYWQLNDIWAAPTWASLEVGGRWKLLHHLAGDAYSPVVISAFKDNFNSLVISVTSDLWQDVQGSASLQWYDWSGKQLDTEGNQTSWSFQNTQVRVGAINSTQIFNASLWQLPEDLHTAVAVLRTTVSTSNGTRYEAKRFYVPQYLSDENSVRAFVDPKLTLSYDVVRDEFTVTSQALAAFVWLDQPLEAKGYFDHNGFWMLPGTRTVKFVPFNNRTIALNGWQYYVSIHSVYDLTTA